MNEQLFITCLRLEGGKIHFEFMSPDETKTFNQIKTSRGTLSAIVKFRVKPFDRNNWPPHFTEYQQYRIYTFKKNYEQVGNRVYFYQYQIARLYNIKRTVSGYLRNSEFALIIKYDPEFARPMSMQINDPIHYWLWTKYDELAMKYLADGGVELANLIQVDDVDADEEADAEEAEY